ncbi:MAG TPA: hypothetical protein VNW90_25390 [Acetobacteraceae bacterium]|jgi:hypothetical protein|nr:hypothetical protein [Acetobacteraceae bacterium]
MNPQNDDNQTIEVPTVRKDYPLLQPGAMRKVLALIDENLGGQQFSPRSLARIKVPSGDDRDFKVETPGGVERRSSVTGVITAFRQARAYWKKPFGVGRVGPPDCSSKDGFIGEGDPGGNCTDCPMAAFNSARAADGSAGPGQACKDLRELLILMPGQMLPHLLAVPPTSLANFTKYSLNLISAGLSYWTVTTKLVLEPATSTGGVPYAKIRFQLYTALPESESAILAPYHERMRGLLTPMTVDTTAYDITGGEADQDQEDNDPDRPY